MLFKTNSSYQSELEMSIQFSSGLQIVKEVINSRLSGKLNIPAIAINLSPLSSAPLFCLADANDPNQMTIEGFLNKCIERWLQEAKYQQDILNLKDQIVDEFEKLFNQIRDENFIEIARKQRDQVVETLFAKTNFDKKNLAAEFCKSFMNGFDVEMIEKIEYYATYIVWMPFITPLPEGLIEFIKKMLLEKIDQTSSQANIVNIFLTIKQYIEDQLKEKEIRIQSGILEMVKRLIGGSAVLKEKNIIKISQLDQILKMAQASKKACILLVNQIGRHDKIIQSERNKIQTISVKMSASQFFKANIPYTYEYLELENLENEEDLEQMKQILLKLPKCLKSMDLQPKINKHNAMRITKNEEKNIFELSFTRNKIFPSQMKFLARLHKHLQIPLSFIILEFRYQPYPKGTNEEITTFSNVFTYSNTIQHLDLNFEKASITTDAIDHLAASISKMNQMNYLSLCFRYGKNSASNHSMVLFAQAISKMPQLTHLEFDFGGGNNNITDDGIVQLSRAITKFACIQQLILYFWNYDNSKNAFTDKGIEELSKSIANLSSIHQLKLNFGEGNHQISDKGMQALAAALKRTNNLSDLLLIFNDGKNSITDASMDFLADALQQMPYSLSIWLRSHNRPRVTAKGESIIRKARMYSKFYFYHREQRSGKD